MAWSSAAITGAELAAYEADYPCILAKHALRDGSVNNCIWTRYGNTTDSDETHSRYPVTHAYDGYAHRNNHTEPDANRATWYFCTEFQTPQVIDTIVMSGYDFDSYTTINVQIADDATFSTRSQIIFQFADTSPYRYTRTTTYTGDDRYSGVEYLRVVFTGGVADAPHLTELWLGQREQLYILPDRPYEDVGWKTNAPSVVTKSGIKHINPIDWGRATREHVFTLSETSHLTTFQTVWEDTNYGEHRFYWIETPDSDPQPYLMRHDGDVIFNPILTSDPLRREYALSMIEQAPYLRRGF